jgi:hypothetical protein
LSHPLNVPTENCPICKISPSLSFDEAYKFLNGKSIPVEGKRTITINGRFVDVEDITKSGYQNVRFHAFHEKEEAQRMFERLDKENKECN